MLSTIALLVLALGLIVAGVLLLTAQLVVGLLARHRAIAVALALVALRRRNASGTRQEPS